MLQIQTIVSQPFEENTYVVWQPPRSDALVIDPGLEPDLKCLNSSISISTPTTPCSTALVTWRNSATE